MRLKNPMDAAWKKITSALEDFMEDPPQDLSENMPLPVKPVRKERKNLTRTLFSTIKIDRKKDSKKTTAPTKKDKKGVSEKPADSKKNKKKSAAPIKKDRKKLATPTKKDRKSADTPVTSTKKDRKKSSVISDALTKKDRKKSSVISDSLIRKEKKSSAIFDAPTKEDQKKPDGTLFSSITIPSDILIKKSISDENLWEAARSSIKKLLPVHTYGMWIEPIGFIRKDDDTIVLSCPNVFFKKRVRENYGSLIQTELNKFSEKPCKFLFEVSGKNDKSQKKKSHPSATHPQLVLPNTDNQMTILVAENKAEDLSVIEDTKKIIEVANEKNFVGRLLRKDFTFDRFVVGDNNDFAYSASLSLASKKNLNQNSLFLLSDTGLGKSHLSQSIGHYILAHHPAERVCYITAEDFTNEMVHAFRGNSLDKFKEKYRTHCDVLILEDVHFLGGKERTQTELALALDYLFDANKKIIFTSCYSPSGIPKINGQLKSRFSSGIVSNIEPPDFKMRVRILEKKIQENGYVIPRSITEYLAGELSENVRQLESGLVGVAAKASLLQRSVDRCLAESVIKNIVQQRKTITIDMIKNMVCEHFNITVKDMISNSRKQAIVRPRQIAIYLARKYTNESLQAIGKSFNKYHATVLHSVGAVEKGMKSDGSLKKQLEFFFEKLESPEP